MLTLPQNLVELERTGQWLALRRGLEALSPNALVEAALARTRAQLGEDPGPAACAREDWIQAYWYLAEARVLRGRQRWQEALSAAVKARESASLGAPHHILAEALFAEAIAHVELGHLYKGLDLFSELARDERNSKFRREISVLNEAWLLYDLGQVQPLRAVVPSVPEASRMRLELLLAVLDCDEGQVADLCRQPARYQAQIESEKTGILGLFCEWKALQGGLDCEWIAAELQSRKGEEGTWPDVLCRLWNGEKIELPESAFADWRDELDMSFAAFLSQVSRSPETALQILHERIDPVLWHHRICPPMIAGSDVLSAEVVLPWQKTLRQKLGLTAVREDKLIVDSVAHTVSWKGRSLDLKRSPVSLQCLVALQSARGTHIRKEDLHLKLTGSRYVPDRHDSRLHKILGRLSARLQDGLGVEPWHFPGDNSVVLLESIEVV